MSPTLTFERLREMLPPKVIESRYVPEGTAYLLSEGLPRPDSWQDMTDRERFEYAASHGWTIVIRAPEPPR
jgi:hypothetical protein